MDPQSPLQSALNMQAGAAYNTAHQIGAEARIRKIEYFDADGKKHTAGLLGRENSEQMIETLDSKAESLAACFYQTAGGGVNGSLITTLILIGLTILIALPLGIGAAIYLNELAPSNKVTNLMRSSIEMLSGVPSIVFGLMGMTMLFPITKLFGIDGPSILLGALTLATLLLPVIIRQTEEALKVVPNGLRMGSLSLGATQTQTIFKVVLPNALPGILSATLLSVSRIIGESAALIYTMGTAVNDNPRIGKGATTLAVQIWSVMSGEQPNFELATAISIIILVLVLILNISVKLITSRLNRRWAS